MTIPPAVHTAFSASIEAGDLPAARELIRRHPELVNHPDWTPPPLHCAVLWNQPEIAQLLLDNHADIEIRDPDRNTTPLRYAIIYCKPQMIQLLLSRGANSGSIAANGTTALELSRAAAAGEFADFDDTPAPAEYNQIVQLLENIEAE